MEDEKRRLILSKLTELCEVLSYEPLKSHCKARNVITDVMIREIERHNENEDTKLGRLLTKITKRGPEAFDVLSQICYGQFIAAYRILHPTKRYLYAMNSTVERPKNLPSTSYNSTHRVLELKPFEGDVQPTFPLVVKHSREFHAHPKVSVYHMHSKHRGVLFLVNIINFKQTPKRAGADADRNNLICLFRQMGFVIFYYEDIVYSELEDLLNLLVKSEWLRRTDCFVFGMMTHGSLVGGKERVQFADEGEKDIEEIISKFYNDKCGTLRTKPKIFILPYCRGDKPDAGVTIQRRGVQTDGPEVTAPRNWATKSDILICYGTVKGFETHRDMTEGSWFVQELCKMFADHAHDTDLEVMLKLVMGRLMEYRTETNHLQTPSVESWGFKSALFFNPGYYTT